MPLPSDWNQRPTRWHQLLGPRSPERPRFPAEVLYSPIPSRENDSIDWPTPEPFMPAPVIAGDIRESWLGKTEQRLYFPIAASIPFSTFPFSIARSESG